MEDKCEVEFHGRNAERVTTTMDVGDFTGQGRYSEDADYTLNDR